MTAFEEFGVLPEIGKAVDDMGWTLPTDVQVIKNFIIKKFSQSFNPTSQRLAKKSSTCENLQYLLHIINCNFSLRPFPLFWEEETF